MPLVDWQLSLCTRLRVCAPRHASWPQASPSNPGRPHFLWTASKELTLFYTCCRIGISANSLQATFGSAWVLYGAVQPAEFWPIAMAGDVALLVGSVTEVAVRVTVPPVGTAAGEV